MSASPEAKTYYIPVQYKDKTNGEVNSVDWCLLCDALTGILGIKQAKEGELHEDGDKNEVVIEVQTEKLTQEEVGEIVRDLMVEHGLINKNNEDPAKIEINDSIDVLAINDPSQIKIVG